MKKIRTPYGASNAQSGVGAALRYAEGYEAAMNRIVKIARESGWRGGDFQQAFCDEMTRIGVDLGPDPDEEDDEEPGESTLKEDARNAWQHETPDDDPDALDDDRFGPADADVTGTPAFEAALAGPVWGGGFRDLTDAEIDQLGKGKGGDHAPRPYAPGQVIEYTSFDAAGYSVGQFIGYAPDTGQDNPADLLVQIRARSGGKPFPVRASQLRAHPPAVGEVVDVWDYREI